MRESFDTEWVEVGIDKNFYQRICTDPSMMKHLRPANILLLSLGGKKIRCIAQGDWDLT